MHFFKYGELPCIRVKQINRGLPVAIKNDALRFKLGKRTLGIQVNDRFQTDEVNATLSYLSKPKIIDVKAVKHLIKDAYCLDTYTPCYATRVPKMLRGKYRISIHLSIEGK